MDDIIIAIIIAIIILIVIGFIQRAMINKASKNRIESLQKEAEGVLEDAKKES